MVWVASLAGGLFLIVAAVAMLGLARGHIDPHDGSCIAVLARNLATTGRYGYARFGQFELWPVEATTGPTLVLPIAIAYRLAGDGPFVANVASVIVVLALLGLVWWRMVPRLASVWGVLSGVLALATILCLTIEPTVALVVPRGEVAAGLLLVLATLVALGDDGPPTSRRAATSGLLLGLGVASKVLLALPGAVLFVAIVLLSIGARSWRRTAAVAVAWVAGVLAVQLAIEIWKLASFGAWQAYADRWVEFASFFRMAGSGFRNEASPLAQRRTLSYRLDVLYDNVGWVPAAFALALVALPLLAWRARRARALGIDGRIALVLAAQTLAVAAWWLFRADIPWLRYLFFACITAPLSVHFAVLAAGAARPRGTPIALASWLALLALAVAVSPPGTLSWPGPTEKPAARAAAVLDAARAVRAIGAADPHARFWSAGWWQHWDLQSVAPLALNDVLDPASRATLRDEHEYLVISDYFNWEQDPRLLALVEAHGRLVAHRNAFFTIYRLHPALVRKAMRAQGRADTAAPWRAQRGAIE